MHATTAAEQVDAVVIGAGVIGLATAARLAMAGREVIILESQNAIGTQTSSRHSEVIHAGIYYPAGSLKARFCVRGRELLYQHCETHQVAHQRCGKLIVATNASQVKTLEQLLAKGRNNGVTELELLEAGQVAELEPALSAQAALLSSATGIIDSHGLMLSLLGQAEQAGASLALLSKVVALDPNDQGCLVRVEMTEKGAVETMSLNARLVVNCAGHGAPDLARTAQNKTTRPPAAAALAKGNYFRFSGRAPCSRLIYPVPEPGGLGVHLTLDLGGQARFGPDVEWVDCVDYEVSPNRVEHFYEAIRSYWPGLPDDSLVPDYAGIRPKVAVNGKIADDFIIQSHDGACGPVLIQLFGFESPGLTSSLAIAEHIGSMQ